MVQSVLPDAVQDGEIWLDIGKVPAEALNRWHVGLTDSTGRNYVLGKLTGEKAGDYLVFMVPREVAPGKGSIWVSIADAPSAEGTILIPINVLKAHETYHSASLNIGFQVPRAWRLYEQPDSILLQRTFEQASTPVEQIVISRCASAACIPVDARVEATETITLTGTSAKQVRVLRATAEKTRSWHEVHTIVKGIDVVLAYRPPINKEATAAYELILKTLSLQ